MSEPSAGLRVVIASDNFLTREGLGCMLSGARGIEIVARVDGHPQTLAAVRQYRPDVLIVGIRTPGVNAEAALSAAQQLRSQYPNIGVVVIAEAGDGYALELLRSRAAGVGYLLDDRSAISKLSPPGIRPLACRASGGGTGCRGSSQACRVNLVANFSTGLAEAACRRALGLLAQWAGNSVSTRTCRGRATLES